MQYVSCGPETLPIAGQRCEGMYMIQDWTQPKKSSHTSKCDQKFSCWEGFQNNKHGNEWRYHNWDHKLWITQPTRYWTHFLHCCLNAFVNSRFNVSHDSNLFFCTPRETLFREIMTQQLRKHVYVHRTRMVIQILVYIICIFIKNRTPSVHGVMVTWNPSKVQPGVRFPLDALLHFS